MLAEEVTAVPDSHATLFEHNPAPTCTGIALASLASERARTTNLSSALLGDWAMRVQSIRAAGLPQVPPLTKESQKANRCVTCGECVCGPETKQIWTLGNKVLAQLKTVFKYSAGDRKMLSDGVVFVCFTWERPVDEGIGADEGDIVPLPQVGVQWVHVGLQYLAPYRPTFLAMVERDWDVGEVMPDEYIPLKELHFLAVFTAPIFDVPHTIWGNIWGNICVRIWGDIWEDLWVNLRGNFGRGRHLGESLRKSLGEPLGKPPGEPERTILRVIWNLMWGSASGSPPTSSVGATLDRLHR